MQQTVDELKELEEEVRQWQEEAAAAKVRLNVMEELNLIVCLKPEIACSLTSHDVIFLLPTHVTY